MSEKRIKVLQVYALTGLGHLREATSIKHAMDAAGIFNETLDILEWGNHYSWYSKLAVMPLNLFKWFFEITTRNTSVLNGFEPPEFSLRLTLFIFRIFEIPLGFALRRFLEDSDYDYFIAVHPWALGALWSFGLGRSITAQMINVIPDEIDRGSTPLYAIPGGDYGPLHLVNSERVANFFLRIGVDPDRLQIIGHTLDPLILNNRNEIYNRIQKKLSDPKSVLCIGLLIGGTGTIDEKIRIVEIIKTLKEELTNGKIKIKVVPGPHLEFANELNKLVSQLGLSDNPNIEIFSSPDRNQVVEMGHKWLLEEIDILFAKTGEIIFYSMGGGFVHIALPPKGSNEVFHLKYMKEFLAILEYDSILDLRKFLTEREPLIQLSQNAFNLKYKLDGAEEVVKILKSRKIEPRVQVAKKL